MYEESLQHLTCICKDAEHTHDIGKEKISNILGVPTEHPKTDKRKQSKEKMIDESIAPFLKH